MDIKFGNDSWRSIKKLSNSIKANKPILNFLDKSDFSGSSIKNKQWITLKSSSNNFRCNHDLLLFDIRYWTSVLDMIYRLILIIIKHINF